MKKLASAVLCIILAFTLTGCPAVGLGEHPIETVPGSSAPTDTATIPSTEASETTEAPTEALAEPTTEPATEPVTQPTAGESYWGICDICGEPYGDGEGFESLCFSCQDLYGPKCSVCGTDCTYRGTTDGMCDECLHNSQSDGVCFWCGNACASDGRWVDEYYVCQDCGTPRPCHTCGTHYYFWQMFEGVCYDCDDPSGGAASSEYDYCLVCGVSCPYGSTIGGLCDNCDYLYNNYCSVCGTTYAYAGMEDGVCDICEYYSTPNVFCPDCGYSWFESGVGAHGFFCPQCGCNF